MCIDQADPTPTSGKIPCWRLQTSIRQRMPGVACIGVVTAGTSSGYFRLEHFQPFRTRNENFPSAIFPNTVTPFLFSSSRHVRTKCHKHLDRIKRRKYILNERLFDRIFVISIVPQTTIVECRIKQFSSLILSRITVYGIE